jgi:Mg2+ and Co2+ transporter CorA
MQGINNLYQTLPSGFRQLFINVLTDIEDASAKKLIDSLDERISKLDEKVKKSQQKRAAWGKSLEDAQMLLEQITRHCERNSTPDVELLRDMLVNRSEELSELVENWSPQEHEEKIRTLKLLKEKLIQRLRCSESLRRAFEAQEKLITPQQHPPTQPAKADAKPSPSPKPKSEKKAPALPPQEPEKKA